jgi:spermidine/putrescine transport system substrate-binding protein
MLDDMRSVFSMAMLTLGYSINDTNPEHVREAYLKLKSLLPNIKLFNSDSADNLFIDEDIIIGMNFNGDTFRDLAENPNLKYIYPKEGFVIWIDNIAIPKGAPHLQNAYKFINFLLRPDIAKEIALVQHYSSPNLAAAKLLPQDWRENPIFNPDPEILKRGQSQLDLGNADAIFGKYWEMLKIGG